MKLTVTARALALYSALSIGALMQGCASGGKTSFAGGVDAIDGNGHLMRDGVKLAPGLLLNISIVVAGKREIDRGDYRIRGDGTVILPLVGTVQTSGKSLEEFTELLREMYDRDYYVNPQVNVEFVISDKAETSPWGYVTVLGCVKTPGRVAMPPTKDLTVVQAIQKVGGLDRYANPGRVEIVRQIRDEEPERVRIDINDIGSLAGGEDMLLQSGDVVYVPEIIF